MTDFAIIKTGGKQYRVAPGQKLKLEKISDQKDGQINFNEVLLLNKNGQLKIGQPKVEGASVGSRVLKNGRDRKIIVFKYKSKIRYRKTQGHRQHFTEVEITSI